MSHGENADEQKVSCEVENSWKTALQKIQLNILSALRSIVHQILQKYYYKRRNFTKNKKAVIFKRPSLTTSSTRATGYWLNIMRVPFESSHRAKPLICWSWRWDENRPSNWYCNGQTFMTLIKRNLRRPSPPHSSTSTSWDLGRMRRILLESAHHFPTFAWWMKETNKYWPS